MSHEVETMFSGSNQRPWHGLGTILPGRLTTAEAIVAAGLDWSVELHEVQAKMPDGTLLPVPDRRAVVRDTDRRVLGTVGLGYSPLQNRDAFAIVEPLVAASEGVWETAGSLWGGRAVWALAKLPGEIVVRRPGGIEDPVKGYLLVTNRHDGTQAVQIKLTPIRVVCRNTLGQALVGGSLNIRHTAGVVERVRDASEQLGLVNKLTAELGEAFNAMAATNLTDAQALTYFRRTLREWATPVELSEEDAVRDDVETVESLSRRLNKVLDLYESGRGAELSRGTAWGAYNAVTELIDHETGYRSDDGRVANVLLSGDGHATKARAYRNAIQLAAR
jgi:phage/plasmid-like protein (TIGR03299 family)